MKLRLIAPLLIAGTLAAGPAAAQFQTPEIAIKYRQGAFSVMAAHFSRIAMMAQGIQPWDPKLAADNAEVLGSVARLPFGAFGPGTEKGMAHRAKPEVWKESAKFKEASERMLGDVAKLEAAAKAGNFEQVKVSVSAVGQSCKSCHDNFRGPKTEY